MVAINSQVRRLAPLALLALIIAGPAAAQDAVRPAIQFDRWQEDWSSLSNPGLRTEPLDNLKYLQLAPADPESFLSLGANLRERFEANSAPSFGVGHQPSTSYLLQRLELDADIRPNANWEIFIQLQDDRAFWKSTITPADQDPLDLEQAFLAYKTSLLEGDLKIRVGRQQIAFDLQRFVSVRDGPNVRQSFDAVWLDWESKPWRLITFWSHPVQYRSVQPFDDYSDDRFQYGGFRVERQDVGPGSLSAYYSRYQLDNARFLFASGAERRNIFDARYAGAASGIDWDLEGMGQTGTLGAKQIVAWAAGTLVGYTFKEAAWEPRAGLQVDVASGNTNPSSGTINTFNPLFPNGYYFTLAAYTGYTNIIHIKPSITVRPVPGLKLMGAIGLQWRETTADAVYTQPDIPVPGTAGHGGRWTGAYAQIRADYQFNANLTGAVEAVHFQVGNAIRSAGGHDSDYIGAELKFGW